MMMLDKVELVSGAEIYLNLRLFLVENRCTMLITVEMSRKTKVFKIKIFDLSTKAVFSTINAASKYSDNRDRCDGAKP